MSQYELVEKTHLASEWTPVRYDGKTLSRFATQKDAVDAAVEYVTDRNCNNALPTEKRATKVECFLMTEKGVFLGILDGDPWFLAYPYGSIGKDDKGRDVIKYDKGNRVTDRKHFLLEGKAEVAVRDKMKASHTLTEGGKLPTQPTEQPYGICR